MIGNLNNDIEISTPDKKVLLVSWADEDRYQLFCFWIFSTITKGGLLVTVSISDSVL